MTKISGSVGMWHTLSAVQESKHHFVVAVWAQLVVPLMGTFVALLIGTLKELLIGTPSRLLLGQKRR